MTAIVTGMYLFAGFRDALVEIEKDNPTLGERIRYNMGGGEVESAQTISGFAFTVENEVNRLYDEVASDAPGVWEYEVGEELGKWLCGRAAVDDVPTVEQLLAQTRTMTLKFLQEWNNNPA